MEQMGLNQIREAFLSFWESKKHQEIHITQPHMVRLRAIKPEWILETRIGEFELK
jgi:hypothetical protein